MNEVIIRIIDTTNNVEGDLDLASYNDFPLAINKGIVNLDNLKERTGTYTKSFKVPNTRNNASLLSNVDNINSRKDYRKALNRKPCIILVNDSPIEKGFVQVSRVYNGLEVESFELVFYGNNIDWVKSAAELQLNQITTWNGNNQQNYSEANIDILNASDSDSYDIAYPYINRGGRESINTTVTDYRPVFYLKNIINRCFTQLGYKTETSFFSNNVHLKKLVCDFDLKFQVEEPAVLDTELEANNSSDYTIQANQTERLRCANVVNDAGNNYDNTDFEYTAPSNATYAVKVSLEIKQDTAFNGGQTVDLFVVKNGTTSSSNSIGNGTILQQRSYDVSKNFSIYVFEDTITANTGDKISMYLKSNSNFINVVVRGTGFSGTSITIFRKDEIEVDDNFLINKRIPDNIKFLDILNDFTRMFNIYYWTDVKSKKVYFDTRNEFFKSESTAIDWSDKVNVNTYEVDYVSSYKRTLNFAYNPVNKDNYLKGWQDENKRTYASFNFVLTDRFSEGNQKIQLDSFSPTYGIKDNNANSDTNRAPVTLRIWNDFENIPETRTTNYNFRIYFFQNLTQTNTFGENNQITKFGRKKSIIPYGIFEDYEGVISPQNLSFTGADGLFSTYYSKMLKNIEEGGRLIAFFDLTSTDIENLDFRKLIYLDNNDNIKGYYFVESVIDYKPVQGGLTKVSLFKFENIGSVDIDTTQTGNNSGIIDNSNTPPLLFPIYVEDGSQLIEVVKENPTTGLIEPVFR